MLYVYSAGTLVTWGLRKRRTSQLTWDSLRANRPTTGNGWVRAGWARREGEQPFGPKGGNVEPARGDHDPLPTVVLPNAPRNPARPMLRHDGEGQTVPPHNRDRLTTSGQRTCHVHDTAGKFRTNLNAA